MRRDDTKLSPLASTVLSHPSLVPVTLSGGCVVAVFGVVCLFVLFFVCLFCFWFLVFRFLFSGIVTRIWDYVPVLYQPFAAATALAPA